MNVMLRVRRSWLLLISKPVPSLHAQKAQTMLFHRTRGTAIGMIVDEQRVVHASDCHLIVRNCLPGEPMKYLPPFELIRQSIEISTVQGELHVNVSYEKFIGLLRTLICGIDVDEAWYVRTYEDIGDAIRKGIVKSARQHFVDDGYFEGRLPFPMQVDETWYLTENPDVATSLRDGVVQSAQEHFEKDGYREGRLPFGM
jgi:hypothetical protein